MSNNNDIQEMKELLGEFDSFLGDLDKQNKKSIEDKIKIDKLISDIDKKIVELKNKKNYDFEIRGTFSDGVEGYFHYIKRDEKVQYDCSKGVEFLFNYALENNEPIGPVGQYMERDINNPLVVLCILKDEVFDKIIETKGELPEVDEIPPDAIC